MSRGFDRNILVTPLAAKASAIDWDQTHCAQFFAELLEVRRQLPDDHLLWAHYAGLTNCWDAPMSWREKMVEEGDPDPPTWTQPPQAEWIARQPDEQLRQYQAIAAEIMVLDSCLGILWDELQEESSLRLIIVSPRGYPLGEHLVTGVSRPILYSEATSIPLLVADPESPIGWRSQGLVQPALVGDLLRSWFRPVGDDSESTVETTPAQFESDSIYCSSDRSIAVRTTNWMLIQSDDKNELYAKPDDRWEFNDISNRCPDVVQSLSELAAGHNERLALMRNVR